MSSWQGSRDRGERNHFCILRSHRAGEELAETHQSKAIIMVTVFGVWTLVENIVFLKMSFVFHTNFSVVNRQIKSILPQCCLEEEQDRGAGYAFSSAQAAAERTRPVPGSHSPHGAHSSRLVTVVEGPGPCRSLCQLFKNYC